MTPTRPHPALALAALTLALAGAGCDGAEASRVTVPVVVDAAHVAPFTTDLGYDVVLVEARVAVTRMTFATGGEVTTSLLDDLRDLFVGRAHAHPGHAPGGEIVGELPGRLVIDLLAEGAPIGDATMLESDYSGANFDFVIASDADGVPAGDALLERAMVFRGTATRDGVTHPFSLRFDLPAVNRVQGVPLDLDLSAGDPVVLGWAFAPVDPFEDDTFLDGVDFAAHADADGVVTVEPPHELHDPLRRVLIAHDHYLVTVRRP